MLAKQAPRFMRQQAEYQWKRFYVTDLSRCTLGLIGLGSIGQRVAQNARSFGMRVIATRRTLTKEFIPEIDELVPRDRLEYLLKESDFVVLALPLTPATRNYIGERELRVMKPSAFLINISRGGLLDESALIDALQEQRLAGAGLDAFQMEPLPPENPLWHMDGVIITPHIGGLSPYLVENANRLFMENLRRYLIGKPLLNVFDRDRGY
jgi:phosphoglycerate dehydrogenase-like enzyme